MPRGSTPRAGRCREAGGDAGLDRATLSAGLYGLYGVDGSTFTPGHERFMEIVHPDDRDAVNGALRRAWAMRSPFSFEHRLVRPDGIERWVLQSGDVFCDENGRPVRMAGTIQNITETKRAGNELRDREELFRHLMEASPDALLTVDGSGTIAHVE